MFNVKYRVNGSYLVHPEGDYAGDLLHEVNDSVLVGVPRCRCIYCVYMPTLYMAVRVAMVQVYLQCLHVYLVVVSQVSCVEISLAVHWRLLRVVVG